MANKRILKSRIRRVCGDIAAQCIFAIEFIPGIDEKEMDSIICRVAALQQATLADCNFFFDKTSGDFDNGTAYHKARTAYFHKAFASLKNRFNIEVNQIVKEMNALLPDAQKELNKKCASTDK